MLINMGLRTLKMIIAIFNFSYFLGLGWLIIANFVHEWEDPENCILAKKALATDKSHEI